MREDCTVDDFIDVVEGNRSYLPCLYVSRNLIGFSDPSSGVQQDRSAQFRRIRTDCRATTHSGRQVKREEYSTNFL